MRRILFGIVAALLLLHGGATAEMPNLEELSLEELLETRINTASKYDQTSREAPASVTIITSEDIERYGFRTLYDVFVIVPGFYTSYDRNYYYVGVRGFGRSTDYNNRVLFLLNGQTLNEPFYWSAGIGTDLPINLDGVERIEIVRGPGSALYGTSAMFAVINIITKKGVMLEGLEISPEMGSYGHVRGIANFGKEFENGLDVMVTGNWSREDGEDIYFREFDDPSTNDGIAEDLDWSRYYNVITTIGYGHWKVQGMLNSFKKGIPTASWGTIFNARDTQTRDELSTFQAMYDRPWGSSRNISFRGFYDRYIYDGSYPYSGVDDGGDPFEYDSFDANDAVWVGGEIQHRWDIRSDNRLKVGLEHQEVVRAEYRIWTDEATLYDSDSPYRITALYLQDHYQLLKNLSILGGLRWDRYSTAATSTTPRGAIVYHPMETSTIKFIYGDAFRAPSPYETRYEDPTSGWRAASGLVSERIRTMELVWEQRLAEEWYGHFSLYRYTIKNLIDAEVDPVDSSNYFDNSGKVRAVGFEAGINARLKRGIKGYANYTYQAAEDAVTGLRLSNSPVHTAKVGLSTELFDRITISPQLLYETDRITVYDTETDPYLLVNLNLSTEPLLGRIKFSFLIRNLFNASYDTPGGFEHVQAAIPQDGRHFIARLRFQF